MAAAHPKSTYSGIAGLGQASQHLGDNYTTNTYYLPTREKSNDRSRQEQLNRGLLRAAAEGAVRQFSTLLYRGAHVDYVGENGATALHHACMSGAGDIVEELCYEGVDVNTYCDRYGTPLTVAAAHGHAILVDRLLVFDARIDTPGGSFGSVLHAACFSGDITIAQKLLDRGASVHWSRKVSHRLENGRGQKCMVQCEPLYLAARSGSIKFCELLLHNGAKADASASEFADISADCPPTCVIPKYAALIAAAEYGHSEVVSLLLRHEAHFGRELLADKSVAAVTVRNGRARCAAAGWEDSDESTQAVTKSLNEAASGQGTLEFLQTLLESGASLRVEGTSCAALNVTSGAGHSGCIELLLSAGAKVDNICHGRTALYAAASQGHVGCVRSLLGHGANWKLSNPTPLHVAAQNGHRFVVKALIRKGMKVDVKTSEGGKTALMLAVEGAHYLTVMELLQSGADPSQRDQKGKTALEYCYSSERSKNMLGVQLMGKSLHQWLDGDKCLKSGSA